MRARLLCLVMILLSAPLTGCLGPEERPGREEKNPAAPNASGDGSTGTDRKGEGSPTGAPASGGGQGSTFIVFSDGRIERSIYPRQPAFLPLVEDLEDAWQGIDAANGTRASLEVFEPNDEETMLVALRFNETDADRGDVPQPPEATTRVHTVLAVLEHPNATLAGRVLLCWGEGACMAYPTEASMDPLDRKVELFLPTWIRYTVNGTELRDHFREHGWVHVRVPVHGVLNVTGTEDDVYAEGACVTERGENNTTQRTCGDELRQEQVFIDGYATRWPAGENNTADLMIAESGIYGRIETPAQAIDLHPIERANGTYIQQAQAEPGHPAVRLFATIHQDASSRNVTIAFNGTPVFDGAVGSSPPGVPGASTDFFGVDRTRVNLTVEADGQLLDGPGALTLRPISFVYVAVGGDSYDVVVDDHRHLEG